MAADARITHPDDPALATLCTELAERAPELESPEAWPGEQLRRCGQAGVFEWFLSESDGGQEWSEPDLIRGYLALSAACLTTTFVITQRMGACRRIAMGESGSARDRYLADLLAGRQFATVGISHLTTSRRHLAQPVMRARREGSDWVLDGYSPWVTGARQADAVVVGATLDDGRQILVCVPTDLPGVECPPHAQLVGLTASQTGPLQCHEVRTPARWLLAGPVENVMQQGIGAKSGGLQTSTLAAGLSAAAVRFLEGEAEKRTELESAAAALGGEVRQLEADLLAAADGSGECTPADLRVRANSLVMRATQAALAAAKGAGYVVGHPAGRWCREALFFLVWSCPQPVMAANLCELAGLQV